VVRDRTSLASLAAASGGSRALLVVAALAAASFAGSVGGRRVGEDRIVASTRSASTTQPSC